MTYLEHKRFLAARIETAKAAIIENLCENGCNECRGGLDMISMGRCPEGESHGGTCIAMTVSCLCGTRLAHATKNQLMEIILKN